MSLFSYFNEFSAYRFASTKKVKQKFSEAAKNQIPVVIIGFNNGTYVKNMVTQLNRYGITPLILDNASTHKKSRQTFTELEKNGNSLYLRCPRNYGHNVTFLKPIYDLLPPLFACTDPDLQLSNNMPENFLNQLAAIAEQYKVFKAGLALSLREPILDLTVEENMKDPLEFKRKYTVKEWEQQFWRHRLINENNLEIYAAMVDTTFCVCNKKYFAGNILDGVRVAGEYSCLHLPWHPDIDIMSNKDRAEYSSTKLNSSGVWTKK